MTSRNLCTMLLVIVVFAFLIAGWEFWKEWRQRYAWLCDDCGDRAARGRVVRVANCTKCGQEKCSHCFPAEDTFLCDRCQPKAGP